MYIFKLYNIIQLLVYIISISNQIQITPLKFLSNSKAWQKIIPGTSGLEETFKNSPHEKSEIKTVAFILIIPFFKGAILLKAPLERSKPLLG